MKELTPKPLIQAEPILEQNKKIGNQAITPYGKPSNQEMTMKPPIQTPDIIPNNKPQITPKPPVVSPKPPEEKLGLGDGGRPYTKPLEIPTGNLGGSGIAQPEAPNQEKLTSNLRPQGGNSGIAEPERLGVGRNDLVRNQLTGLLEENSKYLQLARTGAAQQAASRGLTNSSIAAGAGENAAIQNALPIAQQDAQTNYDANKTSNATQNRFSENQQRQNFDLERDYVNAGYDQDNALLQSDINRQSQERDQYNQLQRDSVNAGYAQDNMLLQSDINRIAQQREYVQQLSIMDEQAFITSQRDTLLQGFNELNIDQAHRNNLEGLAVQFANAQQQARFEVGASFQQQYLTDSSNLQNSWSQEIQAIYSNTELTPEQQARAVGMATDRYNLQSDALVQSYAELGAWNVVVEQFPTNGSSSQSSGGGNNGNNGNNGGDGGGGNNGGNNGDNGGGGNDGSWYPTSNNFSEGAGSDPYEDSFVDRNSDDR